MTHLLGNAMIRGKDILQPRFFIEGYAYIGQDEHWHLKEDAPDWAKKEFEQYFKQIKAEPNEQGIVIQH